MINTAKKACAFTLIIAGLTASNAIGSGDHDHGEDTGPEPPRGSHGGRLLESGDFAVELTVFEQGVPAEFRLYGYHQNQPITPSDFQVSVELTRLGDVHEQFEFVAEQNYHRSLMQVREPHSFDVHVSARFSERNFEWHYESYEGRTQIPDRVALTAGIGVEPVGPATIVETVALTGTVQANPAEISEVRARFPGVVRRVLRDVGQTVKQGDPLARVESNESLRTFVVNAPISGLIVNRSVQPGQVTAEQPLFVIANLEEVWVQLDVFGQDLPLVVVGQPVTISTLDGSGATGQIDWISPLVSHGSQSVRARVVVNNDAGQFRPGQFVRGNVIVATTDVPLAVKRSGLQRFRDFDVVFAQVGDTYEVRMLDLGRQDDTYVEVLGGIESSSLYVTDNSYLIKADIEKSGAGHDH